jgi:hypothetical protein
MFHNRALTLAAPLLSVIVGPFFVSTSTNAQTTSDANKPMSLRPNVVRIAATIDKDKGPQTGFGFIVGQQQNRLVIVTADHVVRGDVPGAEDKAPLITFFVNQGSQVRGTLEAVGLPQGQGDLAVILVENPGFSTFVTDAVDMKIPDQGRPVWVIGRAEGWNVRASRGKVAGFDPTSRRIQVEGLPPPTGTLAGSSGGPLVSSQGIVGMVVDETQLYIEATPIDAIKEQVQRIWHYTWQLTDVAAPLTSPPASFSALEPVNNVSGDASGGIFSCKYENGLKSLSGTFTTSVVFRNDRRADISLFWLDYDGQRTFYSTLHNGEQYSLRTYISHPWIVVDDLGQCLEVVLPGKTTANINVR